MGFEVVLLFKINSHDQGHNNKEPMIRGNGKKGRIRVERIYWEIARSPRRNSIVIQLKVLRIHGKSHSPCVRTIVYMVAAFDETSRAVCC
jgi:hypothetical protein